MRIRQSKHDQYPRIWLMTDPRIDAQLLGAIQRLPVRSAVVFRHYQLDGQERHILFRKIARICRRRGHWLLLAGDERQALQWHADGFHSRSKKATASRRMIRSAPVHDKCEIRQALQVRANLLFLSPLFATASHPGQRPLGRLGFAQLAGLAHGSVVVALGGISNRKASTLNRTEIHGWAGIDAFWK